MLNTRIQAGLALATIMVAAGLALVGCSPDEKPGAATQPTASVHPPKSGAQMWSETCGQCHNLRSPSEFSAGEWQVIVHQMRLRAGLTGDQQQAITDFLKSATH